MDTPTGAIPIIRRLDAERDPAADTLPAATPPGGETNEDLELSPFVRPTLEGVTSPPPSPPSTIKVEASNRDHPALVWAGTISLLGIPAVMVILIIGLVFDHLSLHSFVVAGLLSEAVLLGTARRRFVRQFSASMSTVVEAAAASLKKTSKNKSRKQRKGKKKK